MPNQKLPQELPLRPCDKCVRQKGCQNYKLCKSWQDWFACAWLQVCGPLRRDQPGREI